MFKSITQFANNRQTSFKKLLALCSAFLLFAVIGASAQVRIGTTTYSTLKAAFDAINSGTHTGAITIVVTGNTTETATAVLMASGNGNANYSSVNIYPDGTRSISGNLANALIELRGADNVTIDGRQNGSGTGQFLTLQNNNASSSNAVVWVDSLVSGVGAGARNNTIRNCNIIGGSTTYSGSYGIVASASNSITGTAAGNDNLKILFNNIYKCYYGVRVYGISSAYIQGLEIKNNSFGSWVDPIGYYSIWLYYTNGSQLADNEFFNMNPSSSYYAMYLYYYTNGLVENNVLRDVNNSGSALNIYIVWGTSSIVRNNRIYNINNTSTVYGIYTSSTSGARFINNTIENINSSTGTIYAFYNSSGSDCAYHNNIMRNITAFYTMYTMYFASANNTSIRNNLIANIRTTSNASSYPCWGIAIGSGNNDTIANNVIYNLSNNLNNATSTSNPFGIYISSGTGHRVYHNSVNMYGASTATNNVGHWSAAIYIGSGCSGMDLRNNVFKNSRTGPTGTRSHAIYVVGTGALSGSTYNNNYYHATGTYGILGYLTSDRTDITAWRSATSMDNNSQSNDPQYNADDNLRPASASPLISNGAALSTIVPIDFLNVTRSTTAPTIGAYEQGGDFAGPLISYSLLTNTTSTDNRTLSSVVMTDASGVNTTAGTRPRLYYKKDINSNEYNGNTNATNGWKYVEATGAGGSPFSFTIDYTKIYGGVAPGAIIDYFVVAQDNNSTVNVSINSGQFATQPASVNLGSAHFPITGTINRYAIQAVLSGTLSVGTDAGSWYNSLSARGGLFGVINNGIITGDLTVEIATDMPYETGEVQLLPWAEQGTGGYTITFKPKTATNKTISGSSASGLIRLERVSKVVFDGRFSGSGNYLTFQQNNPSGGTAVFQLISQGAGLGTNNVTIRNCTIIGGTKTNTNVYGIYVAGPTISASGTAADHKNLVFSENVIYRAYTGIYMRGNSTSTPVDKPLISKNSVGHSNMDMSIGYRCLDIGYANNAEVTENKFFNIINTTQLEAVYVYYGTQNSKFTKNTITNIQNIGGQRAAGFHVAVNYNSGNLYANNMISGVIANSQGSTYYGTYGFFMYDGSSQKIYNNTVHLYGDRDALSTTKPNIISAAIGVLYCPDNDSRNNIFINTQTAATNRPYSFAVYSEVDDYYGNVPFTNADYNNYYVAGSQAMLGCWYYMQYASTLSQWQSLSKKDANSSSEQVYFVSNTDLHLDRSSMSSSGLNASNLKDASDDFDGETRKTPNTTKGADEVNMLIGIQQDITQYPTTVFCPGNEVSLSVTPAITGFVDGVTRTVPAGGITSLSKYTWYKNNVKVDNPNSNTFTNGTSNVFMIYDMKKDDAATYKVEVEYATAPMVTSSTSSLYMEFPLAVTKHPVSVHTCEDRGTATLTAEGTGTMLGTGSYVAMPAYQWQKEDPANRNVYYDIPGANQSSYIVDVRDSKNASGNYRAKILGPGNCGPAQVITDPANIDIAMPLKNVFSNVNFTDPMFICSGEDVIFQVNAQGTVLGYQWQRSNDGAAYFDIETDKNPSARTSKLIIENAQIPESGYYRCLVYGDQTCDNVIVPTNAIQIEVQPYFEILEHPQPKVVCMGEDVILNVVPEGTVLDGALGDGYQWQKNGVNIDLKDNPTAKSPILIMRNTNYDHSGSYRCVIHFEDCRGVLYTTTNEAQVYVLRVTEFVKQPESQMVDLGQSAMFTFDAHQNDYPPDLQPDIQWYRGNTALTESGRITGVKSSYLHIKNVQASDFAQNYHVKIQAKCGDAQSDNFALIEKVSIDIVQQPEPKFECEGTDVQFQVIININGTSNNPTYEWYMDGVKLTNGAKYSGVDTETLTINNINLGDQEGEYYCYIRVNAGGGLYADITSDNAELMVKLLPFFTAQPQATKVVEVDKDLLLEVEALGFSPLTYQWYKDGVAIAGETDSKFIIDPVAQTDAGVYTCKAMNECGEVTTQPCVVTVTLQGGTSVTGNEANGYILYENVPNPFATTTTIKYAMPVSAHAVIKLTDGQGREIARLVDKVVNAGTNEVEVNAADLKLSSGVYYYTLTTNGFTATRRLVIAK